MNAPQQAPKESADILFICSLEDLNCLHDYMIAAMAGDDLSDLPRLWNQQIGVIRSRPHPAPALPLFCNGCNNENTTCYECKRKDAAIVRQVREGVLKPIRTWRETYFADTISRTPFEKGAIERLDEILKEVGEYHG